MGQERHIMMSIGEGWSDRSARLPLFDGEKSTFLLWWMKFETYAITCGFHEALLVSSKVLLPISGEEVDQSTDEGKAKMLARSRNAAAINGFSMAFQKASNLVMITRSKCINWPEFGLEGGPGADGLLQAHWNHDKN